MSDMTLVLRLKADGTAEVVGAAKQVAAATAGIGAAGAEAGRVAKAATDEASLAQARLARLIEETRTPVERLKARLAELETLAPFVGTSEQAAALSRATAELDRAIAAHTDQVRTAAAAQARLADLVDKTRSPVERLQATLAELEGLRPFATSAEELEALERAGQAAQAALHAHSAAAQDAAAAQARLAALIDETRTPVERLQARLVDLAALKPFAGTEAETEALARAVASTEAALASYDATARQTATAQTRLAQVVEEGRSPVERLQQRLAELEALRPFARTTAEAQSLASAIRVTEAEIASHSDTVRQAAAAQGQLAQVVERTRTPVERLTAELKQLEGLRPFARTGEETVALERSLARTRAALAQASREQDGLAKSSGLAAHQITNLQYQLSDVVAQLGSGASPFTIMMQQGPQVVDALGGITSATGLVTMGVLALGAVTVAPFAMLTARAMAADKHIRDVSVALEATGRASQATAADIEALTDRVAQSPFFNRAQAEEAIQGLVRMRQISAGLREQILSLAPALGAALGKDAATAALELGDAFAHPAEGAKRLDDALDFLSAAQLESIDRFDRQGNRAAAQQVIYDALLPRLRDLADKGLTPAARAAKELGDAWDGLATSFSRSEPIQEAVRVMTRLLNAMRDIVTWDTPVVRRLTFAQSRLQEESATLGRWEKDGLTTGDRWQEGAFLKSDAAIIDAQRQKVAKLKAEVEALRQDYDQLQQTLRTPETSNSTTGGTSSAPAPNEGQIKQGLTAARELLQVEEQRKALQDKERLLQNAFNATKDAGERRQLGRAIMEVRAAYQALLTPQEQALKAASDETRLANVGRMERVRLAATIQAETEATNQRLVGKDREKYITDKVNAAVRMASESYTENVQVMDATARGALTLVDAYAAGEVAALRQAAANDANIQALTSYGASVEELTQKYLEQRAAEAAVTFAGQTLQYQHQVDGLKAVAAAQQEGVAAVQDAQREQKVLEATSSLRAAAEASGNAEIVRSVNALIERYRALSKEEQEAQRDGALAEMIRQQREGVALSTVELRLVGQTEEQRRLELARLRAINELKAKGIDLEKETSAQRRAAAQTYVDEAVARERINIQLDREREAAAERVRVASKATDDVVEYFAQATDDMLADARKGWRGLWDGVVAMARRTFATIIAEVALRPIVAPVIFSALGAVMPASAASPQGMAGSLVGGQGGLSSAATNWGMNKAMGWGAQQLGLDSAYNGALNWAGGALGLGTSSGAVAGAADLTAVAAGDAAMAAWGGGGTTAAMEGAGAAAQTMATGAGDAAMASGGGLSSAGSTMGSALGGAAAAAGAGYFAGGMLGTATNSKVAGGLGGAAAGGLATYLTIGSAFGPWGIAAGAIIGAIAGMLGTTKASVGPNSRSNLTLENGVWKTGQAAADNGGDLGKTRGVTDQIAAALNALMDGAGMKNDTLMRDVAAISLMEKDGKYTTELRGQKKEFTDQTAALTSLFSDVLTLIVEDGATEFIDQDNKYIADNIRRALTASIGKPVEEVAKAITFASQDFGRLYDQVGKAGADQFSTDLTALSVSFQTTRDEAARLGLTTTGMAESFQAATDRVYAAAMRAQKGLGVVDTVLTAIESWRKASIALMGAGQSPQPAMDLLGAQLSNIVNSAGDGVEGLQRLTEAAAILRGMGETTGAAWVELRASQLRDAVMNDLAAQAMEAEVALGRLSQDEFERRTLERQQREALATVTDAGIRAEMERVHALQRAAQASKQAAAAETERKAALERTVSAAGDLLSDIDRQRADGSTGLTPQQRIDAVDSMLSRDLALARHDNPAVAEEAIRRLTATRQTAKETYDAVYGAGSAETTAMLRSYEAQARDLPAVKTWQQRVLEQLASLPANINANLDLRGRILELYEPAVLQRVDPAIREIVEKLVTLASQGYDFTTLPASSQRTISEILTRLEGATPVTVLDFTAIPANARREVVEALARVQDGELVKRFAWSTLPADAQRELSERLARYQGDLLVDGLSWTTMADDDRRELAEILQRYDGNKAVTDLRYSDLPADAQRAISEILTRNQGGLLVPSLTYSAVAADANRAIGETLMRWQGGLTVNEFDWTSLAADDQRLLAEMLNRYQNSVVVDRFDFAELPADAQRRVAEMLNRTLNGTNTVDWSPIVLPGNASRTVTETVKRDVSETVTSAAMRDATNGFRELGLQTTSVIVKQLYELGVIMTSGFVNVVRALLNNWTWGSNITAGPSPHVLTAREARYLVSYEDLGNAWVSYPAWDPTNHYNTDGWREGRTFAVGGRIYGPGTDTSDDVPAWLSRDEFVIRARAARAAGYDVMEALNAGNLTEAAHMLTARARNDNVPRFATGGRIGGAGASTPTVAPVIMSAPTPWDGGAAAGVAQLTGQVERLTAEVIRLRQERREDAGRHRQLTTEIANDQIDALERQEQHLRSIAAKQRRVAI